MFRSLLRLCLVPLIALSLALVGAATMNVAAATTLLALNGTSPGSTCAMTRSFGARLPLCEVAIGIPTLDAAGTRALRDYDVFLLWLSVGASAWLALWLCMLMMRGRAPRRARPRGRSAREPLRVDFAQADA